MKIRPADFILQTDIFPFRKDKARLPARNQLGHIHMQQLVPGKHLFAGHQSLVACVEIRPPLLCAALRLLSAPLGNFSLIARQQHLWHLLSVPFLRAAVLWIL